MEFDLVMDLARVVPGVVLIRGWLVIEMFGGSSISIVHRAGQLVGGVESVVGVVELLLCPVGERLVVDSGILIASMMVPLPVSLFPIRAKWTEGTYSLRGFLYFLIDDDRK